MTKFKAQMNIKQYNHVYLIGAGGISVSAIAKLLLHHGVSVSGFDLAKSDITDELSDLGAMISIADTHAEIPMGVDLLVYSEAVPENDALRKQAVARDITQIKAAGFWGKFSANKKVIAISGTNGKSTTTAMIGLILENAGYDPTVVVGTRVLAWDSNIRIGKSDWLVIEADEYAAKMLAYKPQVAVITNISADHLDYYKDLDDIIQHFQKWLNAMPQHGTVVLNKDDVASKKLVAPKQTIRLFALKGSSDVRAAGMTETSNQSGWVGNLNFNIVDTDKDWGYVKMNVPGMHAIANAVAAAVAADSVGVPHKKIIKALSNFSGTWRRFEMVGEYHGALVVSDYAHHPDGIRATLAAARGWYPFHRIIVLFQPHHHNRTKNLFNEFAASFGRADEVIISEIYDVSGREDVGDQDVSSKDLVAAIKKFGVAPVSYASDVAQAEAMLKEKIKPEDVVIIMGAGDVDRVARNLIK
ncbi:UDP-N-acetylmuramate--L-alanine ligase [bacterium CG10_46_32]|nr:MAG: UDP-N-acetylmuramate--L-alanine ligase [bacterium CG10_46_32]PIR56086.1 MAG: UDP-N-acetylmuramate--L-alanine ligase [Parcubacteria group bacterium CG10_big_fil_rev_8_21_14_0_10_46_32]